MSPKYVGVGLCTDCWDGGDDLAELQLVEDGGLAGSVQADHQNTHLLLAPEAIEELRECETHLGGDSSTVRGEVVSWSRWR